MTTFDQMRRGITEQPNRLDFKALQEVRAGRVWRSTSGRDVLRSRGGDVTIQLRNVRRLGLIPAVGPGERYSLNTAGDAALDEWLANRPTYPAPTEGPSS